MPPARPRMTWRVSFRSPLVMNGLLKRMCIKRLIPVIYSLNQLCTTEDRIADNMQVKDKHI